VWGASEGAGHMPGQGARLVPGMPALHSIIILATAIPNVDTKFKKQNILKSYQKYQNIEKYQIRKNLCFRV